MNKGTQHPLLGILADLFSTPRGQQIAEDLNTARTVAGDAATYAAGAPERLIDRAQNPPGLDPMEALKMSGDMALTLAGGAGAVSAAKTGVGAIRNLLTKPWQKPLAPGQYGAPHTAVARDVLQKALTDPSKSVNAKTVAQDVAAGFRKEGLPMPAANLDDLSSRTMKMLQTVDPNDADAVRRAVRFATGYTRKGAPTSLAVAGTAGAGAMGEGNDPQRAMLVDLIRRVQAGEI